VRPHRSAYRISLDFHGKQQLRSVAPDFDRSTNVLIGFANNRAEWPVSGGTSGKKSAKTGPPYHQNTFQIAVTLKLD
jgi:hypothetical protein